MPIERLIAQRARALLLAGGLAGAAAIGPGCGKAIDGSLVAGVAVNAVSPREVRTVGGDVVTLSGSNFCPELTVTIGGRQAAEVAVRSEEEATVVTPAAPRGDAVVEASCGEGTARAADGVRYVASTVELLTADRAPDSYTTFADVDGDGWLDGVLEAGGGVELHRGLPEGRGFDAAALAVAAGMTLGLDVVHLAVADFDGDGTSDVMLSRSETFQGEASGWLRLHLLAGGAAGFADAGEGEVELARYGELLRVADLDGDGRQDLVVVEPAGAAYEVSVLHGDGPLSFGAKRLLFSFDTSAGLFELFEQERLNGANGGLPRVDLDGDGISDLVLHSGQRWVVVLGRRDRGYAARAVTLPAGASGLFFFDTDRNLDAYAVQCAAPGLLARVWRGTSAGSFESAATDVPVSSTDWSLYCAELSARGLVLKAAFLPRRFDLDGDGQGEFLLDSSGPLGWIELGASPPHPPDVLTVGTGGSTRGSALLPGPGGSLRVLDGSGSRYLVSDTATPSILSSRLPPLAGASGTATCLGDFDGDGIADLMAIREGKAVLLRGTGTGWFDERPELAFPVQGTASCAAAHFTQAAAADLVTSLAVYRNQGDGTFREWVPSQPRPSVADVDGDGRDELLVFATDPVTFMGDVQVLAAEGATGFRTVATVRNVLMTTVAPPVIADLDGDGSLDEVHCENASTLVVQYGDAQQADGRWGDGGRWDLGAQGCSWVRLMRGASGRFLLTGGGAVLLESADRVEQAGTRSDGQPTSREAHTYEPTGVLPFSGSGVADDQVALCDLRGRGKTDLVYVPPRILGNDHLWIAEEPLGAPATFRKVTDWTVEEPELVGCADLDADGLEDVVVTRGGRPYLLRNVSY